MTDASYLLTTSVQRMSILGIIEALHITTQYGMKNLGIKYSEALIQRVTTDNFIQVKLLFLGFGACEILRIQ